MHPAHLIRTSILAAITALAFAPAGAPVHARTPATTAPATDNLTPAQRDKLEAFDAAARETGPSFNARFTQHRFTPLLKRPLVSTGLIRTRPAPGANALPGAAPAPGNRTTAGINSGAGIVRWDTIHPRPSSMLIAGDELKIHYPQQKTLEVYPLDQRMGQMFISPNPALAAVQQHFILTMLDAMPDDLAAILDAHPHDETGDIPETPEDVVPAATDVDHVDDSGADDADAAEADPTESFTAAHPDLIALALTLRDEQLATQITRARVVLDPAARAAVLVEYVDAEDQRTVILFDQFSRPDLADQADPAAALMFDLPDDTQTVHPLASRPNDP